MDDLDETNKNFLNLKGIENEIVICRKEHICEYKNVTLDMYKKLNYQKGIFFKKCNDDIFQHLGIYVENIHKPIRRRDVNLSDLKEINLDVNENFYMNRTSFVKKKSWKSNSVDWERRKANSFLILQSKEKLRNHLLQDNNL